MKEQKTTKQVSIGKVLDIYLKSSEALKEALKANKIKMAEKHIMDLRHMTWFVDTKVNEDGSAVFLKFDVVYADNPRHVKKECSKTKHFEFSELKRHDVSNTTTILESEFVLMFMDKAKEFTKAVETTK